jgi:hypothetical protein
MYRRRLVPLCTAVAALAATTARGGDAPGTAPQSESTASAPSPGPSPDPSTPPADADPAPPGPERSPDALADRPLAGSLGGGEYRIESGRCVVPLPPGRARLVEGGDTMEIVVAGVSEGWVRVDGP